MISGVYGLLMINIYHESHKNILFLVNHFNAINVHIYMEQLITNRARGTVVQDQIIQANRFLRPGYCGSVRDDFPLTVIGRKNTALPEALRAIQFLFFGKVYLKTDKDTVRIK